MTGQAGAVIERSRRPKRRVREAQRVILCGRIHAATRPDGREQHHDWQIHALMSAAARPDRVGHD
jgi:hypothetical protein